MFQNMPQITFFARSNNDKSDTYALYCRVYLNERTNEFSTKENIDPKGWDQASQVYTGITQEQTDYINLLCGRIKYRLKAISIAIQKEGETLTPIEIINAYRGIKLKNTTIFEVIRKFIDWEIKEGELSEKTIAIHERLLRHLQDWAGRKDYFVADFNEVQAEKFKDWFRDTRNTKNKRSASRHISFFRIALQWAVKKGIIKSHNLLYYQGESDKRKKPVSLPVQDLYKLIEFHFVSGMLNNIKDLFLFQIATGLSYGDLWGNFQIQDTPAGKIIVGNRIKGDGNAFFVPYDEMADVLLKKHKYKLPKYCNGTYNRLLKEIAALVGIEVKLTTHIGRKTFATLKKSEGWTTASISLMLGHSSEKTAELHYIERNADTIIHEMQLRSQQQINK